MKLGCHARVGILADDLTSAADGAAPFVARGMRASIGRSAVPVSGPDVVAVDAGSRSLSAAAAAAKMSELTRQLAGCRILYKTVDSTLRGHIMAELEAVCEHSGRKAVVFAPAFPAAGRTTVNGVQLVNGVPVSNTIYGRDRVHPARTSVLAELMPASALDIIMFDATTQEELESQVAAVQLPEKILWVGSPGMAQALARCIGPEGRALSADLQTNGSDVLVVIGSANPSSHRQARHLESARNVVLLTVPVGRHEDPASIRDGIARDAVARLETGTFGALVATGGDTMEAILDRLNIHQLQVLGELEPGFPLGRVQLADGRPLLIAMKAGGFGHEATLINAVAWLLRARLSMEQRAV